jgi:ribonuclease HI
MEDASKAPKIRIHCDGLCEPNPGGLATYGFGIEEQDEASWREIHRAKGIAARGQGATNNVAEYTAAIRALRWLADEHRTGASIALYSDSQLLVNQLSGKWRVKSPQIRPLWSEARELLDSFADSRSIWVPREQNEPADGLSVEVYVSTLEAERAELAREVSVVMLRPGLYLADRRHQVNVPLGLCSCRDFKKLNSGRFRVRCEHLIAAGYSEASPIHESFKG